MIPYLRLLHCITDLDNVRRVFLRRNEVMDRSELDAQGAESAPPNGYDLIAEAWNDPTFDPWTVPSRCARSFNQPIQLLYSSVANMTPADGVKVKNVISTIRANLLRTIQNWEDSGQGDCGRRRQESNDEDDELAGGQSVLSDSTPTVPQTIYRKAFGSLDSRPQEALDSRENFLNGLPTWYLYFWEQADKFQLLSSCLQRLPEETSPLDGGQVISEPGLSARSKKKRKHESEGRDGESDKYGSTLDDIKVLLTDIAGSSKEEQEHNRNMTEKQMKQGMRMFLLQQINDLHTKIENAEEKYHTTKDDFYRLVSERNKARLKELEEESKQYY